MDLETTLKLKIAPYFINTLAPPHDNTWYNRGEKITQTIIHFGLDPNHWWSVEHTQKTVIGCIEQGIKHTGIKVKKSW